MRPLTYTIAKLCLSLLLLLPACVQEELQQIPNKGEGILRLGSPTVVATVSSDKDTKTTTSLPEGISSPDASAFQIDIYNETGTELVKENVNTTDEYVLSVGKYMIKVTPKTASDPALITTTAPAYFEGSTIVEVKPLQVNTANVTVYWGYSILNVSVTDELAFHVKDYSLDVTVEGTTQNFSFTDKQCGPIYVLGGRSASVTFKGKNYISTGEDVSATLLSETTLPRATSYAVTVSPDDIKTFDIISSVTAAHTYNSGTLTGTDVTLTIANDIPKELISNWSAELKSTDGTTVYRTYSSSNLSNAKMVVANNWPYIPKGTYTLHYAYQMNNFETFNGEVEVTVPAPNDFQVVVNAETSYSRYLNYKNGVSGYTLDLANTSGTGDKVMDLWAQVKISDDILNNSNYASLIGNMKFTYDELSLIASGLKPTSAKIVPTTLQNNEGLLNGDDIISQAWGTHTVAASIYFDGVTKSSSLSCHVTGLPYLIEEMGKSKEYGWKWNNTSFTQDSRASMTHGDNTYGLSPKFYLPENSICNVNVSLWACYYRLATYNPYLQISVSDTEKRNENRSINITNRTSAPAAGLNACDEYLIENLEFNQSASSLCLYEYSEKGNGTCAIFLAKCQILYK